MRQQTDRHGWPHPGHHLRGHVAPPRPQRLRGARPAPSWAKGGEGGQRRPTEGQDCPLASGHKATPADQNRACSPHAAASTFCVRDDTGRGTQGRTTRCLPAAHFKQ